ncbi:MAG: hypothetical protein ABIE14_00805 [Patescibacteria group bacterium]
MDNNKLNVGDESVVIGDVKGNVGNRSVAIGAMDANGNVNLNQAQSTAVGYGAKAGPNSISIGAYAGAGSDLFLLLDQLKSVDTNTTEGITALISELKSPNRDAGKINKLWESVKAAVTVGSTVDLIAKIGLAITTIV